MAVDPITNLINQIYAGQGRTKNYDPAVAAAINNARLDKADIDRAYGRGLVEAQVNYDEAARELLKNRDKTYKQNTDQFAGQGILKSGIFATEQGKVADAYQQDLTNAANRRRASRENLLSQRLSGYNQITAALRNANSAAAARATERRQKEAERRIQAEFQKRQQFLAIAAQQAQQAQMRQMLALARRPPPVGGGGGGGGGGGFLTLDQLFPGLFAPRQQPRGAGTGVGNMLGGRLGPAGGGGSYARNTGRTR